MAWIRTIEQSDAGGVLKDEYERAVKRSGRVANVIKVSSLAPDVLKRWTELFLSVMFGPSPLSRAEREMVAVVVSQVNDCHY